MSAKFNGFTVAFEHPVSEEYMDKVKDALSLFKGVLIVETVEDNSTEWMLREQVRRELGQKLWDVLYGDKKNQTA